MTSRVQCIFLREYATVLNELELIMNLIEKYNYVASLRDKRTVDWGWTEDPRFMISLAFGYLFAVRLGGPRWMENRKPYKLKSAIMAYSLFQGVSYSKDNNTITILRLVWWSLFVRITDFLDTFFFVVTKKFSHITALHWTDAAKRRALLVSSLSDNVVRILQEHCQTTCVNSLTYDGVMSYLEEHCDPQENEIAASYAFFSSKQEEGGKVQDFVPDLRCDLQSHWYANRVALLDKAYALKDSNNDEDSEEEMLHALVAHSSSNRDIVRPIEQDLLWEDWKLRMLVDTESPLRQRDDEETLRTQLGASHPQQTDGPTKDDKLARQTTAEDSAGSSSDRSEVDPATKLSYLRSL
ncbi:hypothetical protein HPB47_017008 [Ixodes persulcatus]|uniref:Uncharacterized protein n=1 Tax=Ixodes persulcatus TaxID=34615 RepID=A0AC60QQF2_IXOPE|nr:hypothetical protein HPB47_017008 [Ixodes persulcatus]